MKHKIVFLPHCENCGELIDSDVHVRYDLSFKQFIISPCACHKCHTFFESVVVPVEIGNRFDFHYDYDDTELGVSEDE